MMVNVQYVVRGRGGNRRLVKKRGDLRLLCPLLHVLIHLLVWFSGRFCITRKFEAPSYEMVSLKEMVGWVICHLDAFLQNTGNLSTTVTVFFIFWFAQHSWLFKSPLQLSQQHDSQKLQGQQHTPNLGMLSIATSQAEMRIFPIFFLLVGKSPEVTNCLRWKLLSAVIQSCELQFFHGLLHVFYAVSYVVWFPAFTDINKGLLVTCIKGTVKGVASVMALEFRWFLGQVAAGAWLYSGADTLCAYFDVRD